MESHSKRRSPHGALTLLEPTPEDEAAGIFRAQLANGVTVRLTKRQLEIIMMPPEQKKYVPVHEAVELGKIFMPLQEANIDEILRYEDENPPETPEFIPEPFEYKPLAKPTSLRLVQMLPTTEDGMMQISLDEYDLDEHIPHYFCLSYTWSNPHAKSNKFSFYDDYADDYNDQNVFPISCNGRILYVRANIYDALQQLPDAPGLQVKRWTNFDGELVQFTDLHDAADDGNLGLVKTILFRGGSVDARDSMGRTPLTIAIIKGHLSVVKALLEAGSDPQIRDYRDLSCIDHALQHDRHEIADFLLTFDPINVARYQRRNKHLGHSKLWIDAICINQDDLQEKSEQVNVMHRIFTQASFVTIWLGKDDGTGMSAASAVRKLFSVIMLRDTLDGVGIEPYKPTDPDNSQRFSLPLITSEEWLSLVALYLRQYFHRMWCLQEAVLPQHVVMYLGEHEIPWQEFMLVTEQLHMMQQKYAIPPSTNFRPVYSAPIEAEAHLISELRMRREIDKMPLERREDFVQKKMGARFWRGKNKPSSIPLLEMVTQTTSFECFDPRDHIYALIGMCDGHPESPQIKADYKKPYQELYADVMRLWFQQTDRPDLEIVTSTRDSALRKDENLPSWVFHFGLVGVAPFWRKSYAAAGKESETFDYDRSTSGRSNELVLEGKRIDTINECATERPTDGQVTMFDFDPRWSRLALSLPQIYPHTREPRTEVLWRTLCSNVPSKDDIAALLKDHSTAEQATSEERERLISTAPTQYAIQFRDQFCASILSHGEKQASCHLNLRTTRSGVLLQALMNLQLGGATGADESGVHRIMAPTEDELAEIRDTSLEGPYYSSPAVLQALDEIEQLYQTDSEAYGGPGCATPSRSEISAFLREPSFRVWHADPGLVDSNSKVANFIPWQGLQTQELSQLPSGQDGFRAQFGTLNGGRRLFVTDHQRYLGLGPMSMQPGDEVWVVKGSRVPILLRNVDEDDEELEVDVKGKGTRKYGRGAYYKYIGDLYVHGIMHGEAAEAANDWKEVTLV